MEACGNFFAIQNLSSYSDVFQSSVRTGSDESLIEFCSLNFRNSFHIIHVMRSCNKREDFIEIYFDLLFINSIFICPDSFNFLTIIFRQYFIRWEYGIFSTQQEARLTARGLPAQVQRTSPWVRRLSSVQRDIRD